MDLSKYEGISGKIALKSPTYRQRLKMIGDCQFEFDSNGEVKIDTGYMDTLIKMIDASVPFYEEVDVKKGDVTAKNFDELEQHSEFDAIIQDAAQIIMRAGQLGE